MSSGAPPAAIAVVRISGPKAGDALAALAGRIPDARRAQLASLRHGGELLDQALILFFPGPASETGEDVAELQLHGGRAVVAAVLAALGTMPGLRPAEPGEFTRRAFENGRIDLSGAEGLADLLFSETQNQRRAALALASGGLARQAEAWQARLLAAAARTEAVLDFSDEDDVGEALPDLADLAAMAEEWRGWLARPPAERLRDGVRVVIAGPPNAGKSSLLNALADRDAAIVSEIEGTTRDLVEAPTAIGGMPFLLVDTAGLRESRDVVESIGVDRARRSLESADIVLWLGPPEEAPDPDRTILVRSKLDLDPTGSAADVSVSSLTGAGLDRLAELILQRARKLLPADGEIAVNARHRAAIGAALGRVEEALSASDPLIVAESLRLARSSLDRLTGRAGVEQMLDSLFGRFCVGK